MYINSESISSILEELAGINITVRMVKRSLTFGHTVSPVTLIFSSVLPDLRALPMFYVNLLFCFKVRDQLHLAGVCGSFANLVIVLDFDLVFIYIFDFAVRGSQSTLAVTHV